MTVVMFTEMRNTEKQVWVKFVHDEIIFGQREFDIPVKHLSGGVQEIAGIRD